MTNVHEEPVERDEPAEADASDGGSSSEVAQASEFGGEASTSTGPDGAAERWDHGAQDEDALLGPEADE